MRQYYDSYSGLHYAPDWDGDLQDEPWEIANKTLTEADKILNANSEEKE